MRYTLDLLPINAFQGRGTPVGGRSLRLFGGGYTSNDLDGISSFNQEAADNAAYESAMAAWNTPAPAAPTPAAPAPTPAAPAPSEPTPTYTPPAPTPAPATQTINDLYKEILGRDVDPSGAASWGGALASGMSVDQIRAGLTSSPEYQARLANVQAGRPADAPAAPVPPLTAAAKPAQWELQPESYDEFTGTHNAPYYIDVNSGDRKEVGQPVQATGVTPVDPNTLAQHVGPNFQGTPTQFYDDKGNLKGVLVDSVRAGLGTREGELILDPMSLGLALKPGETASIDSALQQRNEQGQLLFIDPNTGKTTIYNTGVPAETGSTVKDLLYINERKYGGQIPADMAQGALLLAATMATGGVGGALLNAAGLGAGAAGGLTAAEAASLMGGTLSEAGAAATMGGQLASQGINWGAAATAAARTAAINAAVTAAQGGNIGDVLKAGALGAVTGGAGVAGADLLGGGALAQIGAQTAIATATAAATGRDPVQAALSGALTATLANVVPASTSSILNGAGITDPSIQKAINSAISSSVITAIRGGDVGTAAIMGAVNSGLTSVAGMIGNSQVVQDLKASIGSTIDETIASVKYELGATNAQALPVESSNTTGVPLDTQAPYDANAELDRVIQNLPSSASGVEYTPPATPPLISQATGQSDAELMAQALANFQNNPSVGAPLGTLAGATTSDVDPVASSANPNMVNISGSGDETLAKYNQVLSAYGYSPVTMDDPEYRQWAAEYLESQANKLPLGGEGSYNPNAPLDSGFKPQLPSGEYDPAIAALQKEGLNVTYRTLDQFRQDPGALVDAVYPALAGRQPTAQERINFIDQYSNSNTTSPQDLLKDIYDQIQLDKQVPVYFDQLAPAAQAPTSQPPLAQKTEPVKTPTASASSSSSGDTRPAGGLGTQGAAAAGNEGAPGAVSPSGAAAFAEAQNIVSEAASAEEMPAEDIIIATQRLVFNSATLGASPAQAVASGLVNPDGSLTAKGVKQISDATGLSPSDIVALTNGATTARTDTGSGITSTGAGATTGAATGAALAGTGIGGSTGTNIGGLGTGTGTGVGPGAGTGTGEGSGDGLGLGLGGGSGTGTSGAGTGGVRPTVAPTIAQPSYSYSGAGSQGTTVGALPGNLQATFLQGANVDEYNPFENYNVYQQLGSPAPIRAAEGGSPLQLAQMQQGVAGIDPSLYSVLQKRATPNYFTYGADTSGGNPTTFAGSQLMGKPTPGIPVIPTGQKAGSDWLYQGSGTNPLAMAGTGIASLGAGTMAEGGSAHGGGEGEHIPEFITGATGHYVKGRGTGQSDQIPAMLADGEWVADAATVADLGDGSSDAGARLLDEFRKVIRDHKRSAPEDKIPPASSPLQYMKEALKRTGRLKS